MADFFAELKRRHIYRVGAAYVVVAWALTQVIDVLSQVFELPSSFAQPAIVLLVIGFPVALVAAWIIESKPHEAVATAVRSKNATVDWLLFGAVAVLIALTGYQQIAPSRQAGVDAARSASLDPGGAISLAVLPFANMSGDASQEFFSDGITEEITSALVKIPDLRVVARTSAFEFKNQNRNVQSIGQQLNATHLIEGSVRKAGDRVRITVQLIKAADGTHIWSENYDRQLTDVFAIQEDIGRAIATSFNMRLGLAPGQRLVSDRPADQETYNLYLRGRAALRVNRRQEAIELLDQVVARDPNFAPGWAMLGQARRSMALFVVRIGEESKRGPLLVDAETAGRKAIALAPGYSGGYGVLAAVTSERGKSVEAMDLFKQGLALDPEDPELLYNYGQTLRRLGYLKEALDVRERLYLLEPLIPLYNRMRAWSLLANGKTDAGVSELQRLYRQGFNGGVPELAAAYAQQGRFAEAADLLRLRGPPVTSGPFADSLVEAAEQVLRAAANKSEPPARLPDFDGELNFVYAYTSAPERVLDWPEKALKDGEFLGVYQLWWPTPSSVRKTERFKTLMRNAGMVDYWRARGWPDLCRPVGTNDFVCD